MQVPFAELGAHTEGWHERDAEPMRMISLDIEKPHSDSSRIFG